MNSGRCVCLRVCVPAGPDHGGAITNRVDDHDNNPSTQVLQSKPLNSLFVLSKTNYCSKINQFSDLTQLWLRFGEV